MSRCNLQFSDYQEKIVLNEPKSYDNTPKVLLVDADSILYTSVYNPDRPENQTEEEILLDIEECKFRLNKKVQEISLNIEKWYNIQKTLFFVKGEDNFRYKLYPDYKANRKEKHPFIDILYKYVINELNWIPSNGAEADDYTYSAYLINPNNCIIACLDKDMFQIPGIFYLYNTTEKKIGEFKIISQEEADYNLAVQVLIGDPSDNISFSPRIGIKYAEKHLKKGMSKFSYIKAIYIGYLKAWKNDNKKAKEMLRLSYNLIKLKDIKE